MWRIVPPGSISKYGFILYFCLFLLIFCLKNSHSLHRTRDSSINSSFPGNTHSMVLLNKYREALSSLFSPQELVLQILNLLWKGGIIIWEENNSYLYVKKYTPFWTVGQFWNLGDLDCTHVKQMLKSFIFFCLSIIPIIYSWLLFNFWHRYRTPKWWRWKRSTGSFPPTIPVFSQVHQQNSVFHGSGVIWPNMVRVRHFLIEGGEIISLVVDEPLFLLLLLEMLYSLLVT